MTATEQAPAKKKRSWKGRLFLCLFALPLAGIGVFMLVWMTWLLYDWGRMQQWDRVPCTIISSRLETNRSSDSTTYRVVAKYRYQVEGRTYTASRVSLSDTSDNIGSYHRDVASELERHRTAGEQFFCYVNPADPAEAILYPRLRIGHLCFLLVFVLVFGGFGFGLLIWSFYSTKRQRARSQLEEQHPDAPWLWRPDWAEGRLKSSGKMKMLAAAGFALFWNLISSPVLFVVPSELNKGNHAILFALVFPLVGIGLICWAVIAFVRWKKFGESEFQMASVPGVIGGPLAGVVYTNVKLRSDEGFKLTLSNIRKVTTGSGKNRSTREDILWQDERLIQRELAEGDMSRSAIPVLFHIPYDREPTSTDDDSRNSVFWRLDVEAAVPGVDYDVQFEVPVFRTEESSPDYQGDDTALAEYQYVPSPAEVIAAAGIRTELIADGQRFISPAARRPGAALGLTTFAAIWCGGVALGFYLGAPLIFPIFGGLFGLLLLWGAVDLWLWTSTVEVQAGVMNIRSGLAGLTKRVSYPLGQISDLRPKSDMQAGNKVYYALQLHTLDGKKHPLIKRLNGQREAERVGKLIMEALRDSAR